MARSAWQNTREAQLRTPPNVYLERFSASEQNTPAFAVAEGWATRPLNAYRNN